MSLGTKKKKDIRSVTFTQCYVVKYIFVGMNTVGSISFWLDKAEKLMNGPGKEELFAQRAELEYLGGVPVLPWPQPNTELQDLCASIGMLCHTRYHNCSNQKLPLH